MDTVQFVFALHDHQPVGNFGFVFADAYDKAYHPFLELLEQFPRFRACLHHTGPLLQWIEANRPEYLDRLGALVARGQVELFGGAFYEPILSIIPEADRLGQILMMSDWLDKRFGVRPRGMWLAERVWEPTLPRTLRAAGMEYTVLDDSHFRAVGIRAEEAHGYFLTEDQGEQIAVFPISEAMRQRIPYQDPAETVEYLRAVASSDVARTIVMADDGEKFGVWPDSHRHCYLDGWMYLFAEIVTNNEWIRMRTFSEVLDSTAPLGRAYLPTASYVEMMEWAMPPHAQAEYRQVTERMKECGDFETGRTYLRGGFWRSFFRKYDEANLLHKKMIHVSRKLHALPADKRTEPEWSEAIDHLWQAQCNCGYWHGLFGGVYLTNLRHALFGHLIAADKTADRLLRGKDGWVEFLARDFDTDGYPDLLVETPAQAVLLLPHLGGMIVEHDVRHANFNVLDTFMRRREYYHDLLEECGARGQLRVKEGDLERHLAIDWYRRGSLIDHFLGEDAEPENFRRAAYSEAGDFVNQPYEVSWARNGRGARIEMRRDGVVQHADGSTPVRIEKSLTLDAAQARNSIVYRVTNLGEGELRARFAVEFNTNLLAGDAPDRYHLIEGAKPADARLASIGAAPDVSRFAVVDEWQKLSVAWKLSTPAEYWRLPIETVSNSEYGIERIFQGCVSMPVWELHLQPGDAFDVTIEYDVLPL